MNRVKKLADRPPQDASALNRVPFYSLIPLDEIIAEAFNVGVGAKKVKGEYEKLIKTFGSELKILLETETEKLAVAADSRVAEGIKAVKRKRVKNPARLRRRIRQNPDIRRKRKRGKTKCFVLMFKFLIFLCFQSTI